MPNQIKYWESAQDGLEKLKFVTDGKMPKPGKGEVLVEIKAISLNYRDTEGNLGRKTLLLGVQLNAQLLIRSLIILYDYSRHGIIQSSQEL